jgi:hypothetical protein
MLRVAMFVRDMVIALALGWIGISIEPVREEACTKVKGADTAVAMCTGGRAGASFNVAGFGVEMAAENDCATTIR